MTVTLNHTIVPARDKAAAARDFAQLFGCRSSGRTGILRPCASMTR